MFSTCDVQTLSQDKVTRFLQTIAFRCIVIRNHRLWDLQDRQDIPVLPDYKDHPELKAIGEWTGSKGSQYVYFSTRGFTPVKLM